jgi:hypothetical protein
MTPTLLLVGLLGPALCEGYLTLHHPADAVTALVSFLPCLFHTIALLVGVHFNLPALLLDCLPSDAPNVLQLSLLSCVGLLYLTAWKVPHYYIGHRIDTHFTGSHWTTLTIVAQALLYKYFHTLFQWQHVFFLLVLHGMDGLDGLDGLDGRDVRHDGGPSSAATALLVGSCVLVDVCPIVQEYWRNMAQDHHQGTHTPQKDTAPPLPRNSPLRTTIERVARQHHLLPQGWNTDSLRCAAMDSTCGTNHPCGINAVAIGTNTLVLNLHSVQTMKERQLVAMVLHELGHLSGCHVQKDNQARILVHLVRAALVGWATYGGMLYNAIDAASQPTSNPMVQVVFGYLLTRTCYLHPTFNLLGRKWLTSMAHEQEFQADQVACDCGYGDALYELLESFQAQSMKDTALQKPMRSVYAQFYSDHPTISERMARVKQRVQRGHGKQE